MTRPQPGDVYEVATDAGRGYAQYVLSHEEYGQLLRVLPGLFEEEPEDLAALVAEDELFWAFFPLNAALGQGLLRRAGHVDVPSNRDQVPLMRKGTRNPDTGSVEKWWLWDGEEAWPVATLTDEVRAASPRGIINDTLLKERIVDQWRPVDDLMLQPLPLRGSVQTDQRHGEGDTRVRHYTYWPNEAKARAAESAIGKEELKTSVRPPVAEDGRRFLSEDRFESAAGDH